MCAYISANQKEHLSFYIYIYMYIYVYIYMYMHIPVRVNVCMCVCISSYQKILLYMMYPKNKPYLPIHIYIWGGYNE